MPIHNDPHLLTQEMQEKLAEMTLRCAKANIPFFVYETLRDQDVQNCYYMQGRASLENVNTERRRAGLYQLDRSENTYTITDSTNTVYKGVGHGNGTAFDIVPLIDGKLRWNAPKELWEQIGKIGEECGLVWGGRWAEFGKPGWDGPHFQLPRKE